MTVNHVKRKYCVRNYRFIENLKKIRGRKYIHFGSIVIRQ